MPIPCAEANGLLPGLGMPGVGAVGVGAGLAAFGSSLGSSGFTSGSASTASAFLALPLVALVSFGASSLGLASGKAARSLLATGGVMVDDPLLTYSPSSLSFATASEVSIPSSLAMSYTRGNATYFLLSGTCPVRAGFSALRYSFRGAHYLSNIFSACSFKLARSAKSILDLKALGNAPRVIAESKHSSFW